MTTPNSTAITEDQLLKAAFAKHRAHRGAIMGLNFVSCSKCYLHVSTGTLPPDGRPDAQSVLYRHWKSRESYDKKPITSADDPRLEKGIP